MESHKKTPIDKEKRPNINTEKQKGNIISSKKLLRKLVQIASMNIETLHVHTRRNSSQRRIQTKDVGCIETARCVTEKEKLRLFDHKGL